MWVARRHAGLHVAQQASARQGSRAAAAGSSGQPERPAAAAGRTQDEALRLGQRDVAAVGQRRDAQAARVADVLAAVGDGGVADVDLWGAGVAGQRAGGERHQQVGGSWRMLRRRHRPAGTEQWPAPRSPQTRLPVSQHTWHSLVFSFCEYRSWLAQLKADADSARSSIRRCTTSRACTSTVHSVMSRLRSFLLSGPLMRVIRSLQAGWQEHQEPRLVAGAFCKRHACLLPHPPLLPPTRTAIPAARQPAPELRLLPLQHLLERILIAVLQLLKRLVHLRVGCV